MFNNALSKFISNDKNYKLIFFCTCAVWFILWSVVPLFIYDGTYVDTAENIAIGKEILWGYDKHPYFGVWIMRLIYTFSGGVWLSFIFSQIFILIFLVSSWNLARYFLPPAESLVSILFLLANPVYSVSSILFNQNTILIALWALIILFYYKSLLNQNSTDWFLLGIFCGLGLMTKYFCVFLFIPMGIWIFLTREGRRSFKNAGLYLCIISFSIVILPNIIWQFDNDFASILYASYKAETVISHANGFLAHILNPLAAAGMIFGSFAFSLIAFFICFRKRNKISFSESDSNRNFIYFMAFCPLIIVMLFTMISGTTVKGDWLLSLCGIFGLFIMLLYKPFCDRNKIRLFAGFLAVYAIFAVILHGAYILYYTPYLERGCLSFCTPFNSIGEDIEQAWNKKYHIPIKYVLGSIMLSGSVSVFSKDRPDAVFISEEYNHRNKIFKPDFKKDGAVIVWAGEKTPDYLADFSNYSLSEMTTKAYPRAVKPWFRNLIYNYFGLRPKTDFYSFVFIEPSRSN